MSNTLKCEECGRAIRSLSAAEFLFLRDEKGATVEVWCHKRCVKQYNYGPDPEEYDAEVES